MTDRSLTHSFHRLRSWGLLALLTLACQPSAATSATAERQTPTPTLAASEAQPTSPELPIEVDNGIWGAAAAPVTVVVFTDLQCPFCALGHALLIDLERHYGEDRLRVVVKHVPLANHEGAVPAARVAQAVLALGGRQRFFQYLDIAFANQDKIAEGRALELALPLGLDTRALKAKAASAATGLQVLRDANLADRIGVPATPHYRINGLSVTGVQPIERLERLVDSELGEAARLRAQGVRAEDVYARRVHQNFPLPESNR